MGLTYLHGTLQMYEGQYCVAQCMVHHPQFLLCAVAPSSTGGLVATRWLEAARLRLQMVTY